MYRTYVYIDGHPLARRMTDATGSTSQRHTSAAPLPVLSGAEGCWVDLISLVTPLIPLDHDLQGIRYYAYEIPCLRRSGVRRATGLDRPFLRHTRLGVRAPAIVRLPPPWVSSPSHEDQEHETSLVTHLLRDAVNDLYDIAVIVTDDPALAKPIQIVTRYLGKRIGVLWPSTCDVGGLAAVCSFVRHLSSAHLAAGRIPVEVRTSANN